MALYADENFPLRVVEELRQLGQDVLTAFEDGRANQSLSDIDLLTRATVIGRALLTLNRIDFKRLHRQMPTMPESSFARKIPIASDKRNALQRLLPSREN